MRYAYPCKVQKDSEGWFLATFADVPEAGTDARTREEALRLAPEALAAALGGYVKAGLDIPAPGAPKKGQPLVALPPLSAAKLALYTAMREEGVSNTAMEKRLGGVGENAVRRLIDPAHRSRINSVHAALNALGRTLVVEDRAA